MVRPRRKAGAERTGRAGRRRAAAAAVVLGLLAPLGVLAVAGPAVAAPALAASPVESWVTDFTTTQRLAPQPVQRWVRGTGPADSTVVVDPTRRYQSMTGFDYAYWLPPTAAVTFAVSPTTQ